MGEDKGIVAEEMVEDSIVEKKEADEALVDDSGEPEALAAIREMIADPDDKEEDQPGDRTPSVKPQEEKPATKEIEPSYSEPLLRDAEAIGMTWEEVKQFTPTQLQTVVHRAIRIAQSFERSTVREDTTPAADTLPPELDPEDIDESILANMNWIKKELKQYKDDNLKLRDELFRVKDSTDRITQRELEETHSRQVDTLLKAIDTSGMLDIFGANADDATEEQFDNRKAVARVAGVLELGYREAGIEAPADLFQRAIRAEFGNRMKEQIVRDVSGSVQRRSAQRLARPTQRKPLSSQGSDEDALLAIREKLAEFGQD